MTLPPPPTDSPLPTTHILTYITGHTTAPRLRKIVTRGLLFFALLHLLPFLYLAWSTEETIRENWEDYGWRAAPGGPPAPLLAVSFEALFDNFPALFFTCLIGTIALILLLCAKPAGRGRRLPAYLATAALVPFIGAALLSAAFAIAAPLFYAFSNKDFDPSPLPWLLLSPPAALLALLTKDLLAYILWAAKNPLAEKPKTPFLPARPAPQKMNTE